VGWDETQLALDMGLFINGLPVATFELKNSLAKQTVDDAVRQYMTDRNPREKLFEFGRCVAHLGGIEGFWSCAKTRLAKFRGMHKHALYLHLKECEFRFNHRHEKRYEIMLDSCRKMPVKLS